ncbi:MAG: hypothetical protein IJ600_08330 [Lachnospiraceae bacterium]|nr:hypothetical protein [Lachnospiraceae bacterium]
MEREVKRQTEKGGNGGLVAILLLVLLISVAELVLLILQQKKLETVSAYAAEAAGIVATAEDEAEQSRIQMEAYRDERDSFQDQLETEGNREAAVTPAPTAAGTGEAAAQEEAVPTESGAAQGEGTPTEAAEAGEADEKEEVQYEIVEDINRIYQDNRYTQFAKDGDPYDTKQYTYSFLYSYPTDVVFLGDSLTERCSWNEMFPDLRVLNRGIGGDTVNGVLVRLDTVMKTQPKKIFLMVGVNNLMNGNEVDQIIEDYSVLLDELQEIQEEDGCKIYVESILPAGAALKNASRVILDGREVNAAVREMCEDRDITYIDLTDKFSNEDLGLRNEYDYDGVHINAKGYRVLREILEEYVYEDLR